MKRPKIIYVTFNVYGVGGTVRTVVTQANALVARGFDVEIAVMQRTQEQPAFPLDGRVRVVPLTDERAEAPKPDEDGTEDTSWHAGLPEQMSADPLSRRRTGNLVAYLRGVREGIVVATRASIALIVRNHLPADVPRIVQEHMHALAHKGVWRDHVEATYPTFDAIVTLSRSDLDHYAGLFPGVRVRRIPNAVHSLDVPQTGHAAKVVVTAGRLDENKGFHQLIAAFERVVERHPDWTLRIYGGGPEEERLRRMVLKRHLYNNVFVMGPTRELDRRLAQGSIFAMSSKSEGFGMVLLEAMNCGLPAVSYACPIGPREILTGDVDGLLIPEQDVDALADGINRLIGDESLRRKLSDAARRTVAEHYGPDPIADAWEHLFLEVWKNPSPRPA